MSNTRQQILETTSALLERQGYHATGLNQIVAESATPRGSLYYYFPAGKEELAAEAIEYQTRIRNEHTRQQLARFDDPIEAIYRFILHLADHLEQGNCTGGAPLATVSLETATSSDRLRQTCERSYQSQQAILAERLQGDGFSEQRAATLALTISAALEGSIILSRGEKSSRPIRVIAEEVQALLRAASVD